MFCISCTLLSDAIYRYIYECALHDQIRIDHAQSSHMQRHDASGTDSLRTNYPMHTFDFDFSYYCSSLLFYAGTPTLTPSTNTNAASTSCPITACSHERDRQHVTHHRQRAASIGYPCQHIYLLLILFYSILFYSILFDLI